MKRCFALLVYVKFFVSYLVSNVLAGLNLAFSDANFFVNHSLFLYANALLRERHSNFLIASDLASSSLSGSGSALHHYLLPGNGHLHSLVLGYHFLAKPHLSTLYSFFVGPEHLASKLNALLPVDSGCSCI